MDEKKSPTKTQPNTGLSRLVNAAKYSYHGFRACYKTEEAFRQEIWISAVLLPLGLWIGADGVEKSLLAGTILFVLVVELLNTAVERAIDRISFERHNLSKDAKDMGSAAVLCSLIFAVIVWVVIGLPRFYTQFMQFI